MMYSLEYKRALALLCRQSARLEYAMERNVSEEALRDQLALFAAAKVSFLREKEKLGFKDGLSFMEGEPSFLGFSFKKGKLVGSYEHLCKIIVPWLSLPEDEKNHYRYEVANLILCHYYVQQGDLLGDCPFITKKGGLVQVVRRLIRWIRKEIYVL